MRGISGYLRRHHLGLIAIFIALSGTAFAATAAKNSVTSRSIRNGQIKLKDLGANSVNGPKVVNDSLTDADILESSLEGITGERGPQGEQGSTGPQGPAGSPDTGAQILGKLAAVDGPGSGLEADLLDGISAAGFIQSGQNAGGTDLTGSYPNPTIAGGAVGPDELGPVPAARARFPVADDCVGFADVPTGTELAVTFFDEAFDAGDLHPDGCPSPPVGLGGRLIAPRPGLYEVSAGVVWTANSTGRRSLAVLQSPGGYVTQDAGPAANGDATLQSVSTLTRLQAGEYVEARVHQTSGSTLTLDPDDARNYLAMAWLGP